jgi:hypothetical protein
MTVILKNNAFGFLATAVSNSDTVLTLQSGYGASFPTLGSGDYFYATIAPTAGATEIVKVTARTGDSLTVVRAQEGTSALSFAAGSRIELRVTAQSVRDAIADGVAGKDQASEISFVPHANIAATNVQAAVEEVVDDLAAVSGSTLVGYSTSTGPATTVHSHLRAQEAVIQSGRFRAGYGTKADYPKAGLHINKTATNHAHYGVLDDTIYNFTGATDPIIGNASYNDNTDTQGSLGFDHHHSYQAYPHVNMTAGTISVLSSFWSLQDVVTGTVSEASGVKVNNPSGGGSIVNNYGVFVGNLTRGSTNNFGVYIGGASGASGNNAAIFSAGVDVISHFGGYLNLGRGSTPQARFGYDPNLGHLIAQPRDTYDFKIAKTASYTPYLRFGDPTTDAFDSLIGQDSVTGQLQLVPRSSYGTEVTAGVFHVSGANQRIGVGFAPSTTPDTQLHLKASTDRAGVTMENTAGPNKWQIFPAFPFVSNTGLAFYDDLAVSNKTRAYIDSTGNFQPGADNVFSCGTAARRWSVVYADNGSIQTSDARVKTAVVALTDAELNAAKQLAAEIGTYRFLNAVAEKGDKARMHAGMTVQRAIEIMTSHGLQPTAYAFICHDSWDDLYENIQTNVGEKVKAVRQIERQKSKQTERKITEIKMVDGKAVACTSVQISEEVEFSEHLVFNEDGTPLMYEARPAVAAIYNDEGNLLHPAVAATYEQVVHREPVIEIIDQEYEEDAEPVFEKKLIRPAGDRYSFRPDELLMFIAKGIDARISAIETKTA